MDKKEKERRYTSHARRLTLLDFARKELGKKEEPKGSNWGGDIPKYLKSVGITFPAPWCMAKVYYVVDQFAKQEGIKNPLYKTGGVAKQYQMRPYLRVTKPKAGDIFIMIFKDGSGHCGFVERVEGDWVYTIEGNSNTTGSSEGYEVVRNKRKIEGMKTFLRVIK